MAHPYRDGRWRNGSAALVSFRRTAKSVRSLMVFASRCITLRGRDVHAPVFVRPRSERSAAAAAAARSEERGGAARGAPEVGEATRGEECGDGLHVHRDPELAAPAAPRPDQTQIHRPTPLVRACAVTLAGTALIPTARAADNARLRRSLRVRMSSAPGARWSPTSGSTSSRTLRRARGR
jgi:hypothetical protein